MEQPEISFSDAQKALFKSLAKVIVAGISAWLATSGIDDPELRAAIMTFAMALLNSGYTWFDKSDPRFGPFKKTKIVKKAPAKRK